MPGATRRLTSRVIEGSITQQLGPRDGGAHRPTPPLRPRMGRACTRRLRGTATSLRPVPGLVRLTQPTSSRGATGAMKGRTQHGGPALVRSFVPPSAKRDAMVSLDALAGAGRAHPDL